MAVNPHLAGDMRRDLTQLQLLYDMGELGPEQFRRIIKSLATIAQDVEHLVDDVGDEPFVTVTPAGIAALATELQRRVDVSNAAGVQQVRLHGHLGVIDGGLS